MDFDMIDRVEEERKHHQAGSRRLMGLNSDQDAVVSPYAIRNLTETEIVIQQELTQEEIDRKRLHDQRRRDLHSQRTMPSKPSLEIIEEGTE